MHIPDGFLSTGVSVVTWVGSARGVSNAVRQVDETLGERQVPLMGVTAAFIFAAQMMNFPVAAGTSGHLLGGALAAILFGPLGRHDCVDKRPSGPGAAVPGRRTAGPGRQHLQHVGHRHTRCLGGVRWSEATAGRSNLDHYGQRIRVCLAVGDCCIDGRSS
jgi:hypothetical protein